MAQLEILCKKAIFCQESIALNETINSPAEVNDTDAEDAENVFAPTTFISLPILTRSVSVNEQPREESEDAVKTDPVDNSAEPEYNWSTKFGYNHTPQMINDLLLCDSENINIFLQDTETQKKAKKKANVQSELFGIINLQWKEWMLSAINNKDLTEWQFCLPVLDPTNQALKKGELDLEIRFYAKSDQIEQESENVDNDDAKKSATWQLCGSFNDLIPCKYSLLTISTKHIESIPSDWFLSKDENRQNFISIMFDVNCSNDYSEKIAVDLPLQSNENGDGLLLDKEWMFFVDEDGLKYYLNKAQNKESFEIQAHHIIGIQDKKKGTVKTLQHQSCLFLDMRSFTRPGTCSLTESDHIIQWIVTNKETEPNENKVTSVLQSEMRLELKFADPLIEPYIKPILSAAELSNTSQLRKEHELAKQNQRRIKSSTKFQAIIASIQEELKEKYLKICTNYKSMTKDERTTAFVRQILSSTQGEKLTDCISQIIAEVAKEEMYKNPNLIKEELTITLRAKLEEILHPVFEQVTKKEKKTRTSDGNAFKTQEIEDYQKKIEPYLESKSTKNVFAEPLRDIDTILILIEIALLNQDYKAAHKWITQAMIVCDDQTLYGSLYLKLAFVLSQNERLSDDVSPYHCVQQSLSNDECKESLFAKILMLCEQDKLEEAEPSMNKLLSSFPNDPFIEILHGLFEYLMEETEDAQSIWQKQLDLIIEHNEKRLNEAEEKAEIENEEELEYEVHDVEVEQEDEREPYSLYDLWIYSIKVALKFGCKQMAELILKVSKPFFQETNKAKIDLVLMEHHCLVYRNEYELALKKLAEAILLNDKDTRIWLHIGSTYSLLDRQSEAIEALERHINECHDQQILPNLMGIFKLVEIFLGFNEEEKKNYKTGLALIEICWDRIEKDEIFSDDQLNILVSFEDRNDTFIKAIKYKLLCIQAEYFDKVGDKTAALSHYAVKFL